MPRCGSHRGGAPGHNQRGYNRHGYKPCFPQHQSLPCALPLHTLAQNSPGAQKEVGKVGLADNLQRHHVAGGAYRQVHDLDRDICGVFGGALATRESAPMPRIIQRRPSRGHIQEPTRGGTVIALSKQKFWGKFAVFVLVEPDALAGRMIGQTRPTIVASLRNYYHYCGAATWQRRLDLNEPGDIPAGTRQGGVVTAPECRCHQACRAMHKKDLWVVFARISNLCKMSGWAL